MYSSAQEHSSTQTLQQTYQYWLKIVLVLGAGLYTLLLTQSIAADTLTVVVSNINKAEGSVMVAVLAGQEGFEDDSIAPAAALMRPAVSGEMTFIAADLAPGDYAIRVMHDVNGNGELDANFIGMPTEPWSMSNNAKGNFGPPTWKDVRFEIQGDTTQNLELSK